MAWEGHAPKHIWEEQINFDGEKRQNIGWEEKKSRSGKIWERECEYDQNSVKKKISTNQPKVKKKKFCPSRPAFLK